MAAIQFHLDESVQVEIAVALRRHGVKVSTPQDSHLLRASDNEHIDFAHSQDSVLVTHDDDFLRLDNLGVEHAGIAYCHQAKYSFGELLRMLLLLRTCYTRDEMRCRVEFL